MAPTNQTYANSLVARHFANGHETPRHTVLPRDTVQELPYPPPPSTPTIALHASTYTPAGWGTPTAAPTVSVPSTPTVASPHPHGMNVAFVAGAAVAGAIVVSVIAALATWLIRRNAKRLQRDYPRFSMFGDNARPASTSSSVGNVWISTSRNSFVPMDAIQEAAEKEAYTPEDLDEIDEKNDMSSSHRFSSPAALNKSWADAILASGTPTLPSSVSAPIGSSVAERDFSRQIQRQKAAELAQMVRMKFVQDNLTSKSASSHDLGKRQSVVYGLGIVEEEGEVDIANTAISALQRYSISIDPATPTMPVSDLFQVDKDGRVVRNFHSPQSPSTPASPSPSYSGSLTSESGDFEEAVIVRMAHTRSMEIERGVLVSTNSQLNNARLSTMTFPSPPTLSPIDTGIHNSLSADIEESLEARVFGYRDSGPWSKEQYRLTTPGQVRALSESLSFVKPASPHQQADSAWPWPAHRSAVDEAEDP